MWIIRIDLTPGIQIVYSKAEQGFTKCIRMKKRILVGLITFYRNYSVIAAHS